MTRSWAALEIFWDCKYCGIVNIVGLSKYRDASPLTLSNINTHQQLLANSALKRFSVPRILAVLLAGSV